MVMDRLEAVARLAKSGDHETAHAVALEIARDHPGNVRAQLAAAYACDRLGLEESALPFYQAASEIGVPPDEKPKFLLGFGSTLRNLGQAAEAIDQLARAVSEHPERPEFRAFLALAYHSAGQHSLALGTMLEAALMASRDDGFGVYARALREYRDELLKSPDVARG